MKTFNRARKPIPLTATEVRYVNPIFTTVRAVGFEHLKVFCYSKVVGAPKLNSLVPLQNPAEPWLHCIAVDNDIVAYVWDTRVIAWSETNPEAAKALKSAPLEHVITDQYSAYQKTPMLTNPNGIKGGAVTAMKLAQKWCEPRILVQHYQNTDVKGTKVIEFDVVINVPEHGEILVGTYEVKDKAGKLTAKFDIPVKMLSDVYPNINKSAAKLLTIESSKLITYPEMQAAVVNALTM